MQYFWLVLRHKCPSGHSNEISRVFSAPDGYPVNPGLFQSRLGPSLPCSSCPPGTVSFPKSKEGAKVDTTVHGITNEQCLELGIPAESLVDS
jgi:hypothetical protein